MLCEREACCATLTRTCKRTTAAPTARRSHLRKPRHVKETHGGARAERRGRGPRDDEALGGVGLLGPVRHRRRKQRRHHPPPARQLVAKVSGADAAAQQPSTR
eukprot:1127955-Rhodomonas_salina.1